MLTDQEVETTWDSFSDIHVDENDCITAPFQHFEAGDEWLDVMHWFDDQHSKGVAYLCGLTKKIKGIQK